MPEWEMYRLAVLERIITVIGAVMLVLGLYWLGAGPMSILGLLVLIAQSSRLPPNPYRRDMT